MNTGTLQIQGNNSRLRLSRRELALLAFAGALCLLGILGPYVAQYEHYHHFADQSMALGVYHIWDVLSNLPFAILGVWGLKELRRSQVFVPPSKTLDMCRLFFYGLIVTSVCSSIYHLNPDNMSLWLDRTGMTVAFAGMIGLAISNRISDRAGQSAAYFMLVAGPISLWVWQACGNLLAWSLLQAGGMVVILVVALLSSVDRSLRIPLAGAIGWYGLSKVLELGDYQVYDLTQGIVSGHSLKHVAAAFAALPLILFMRKLGRR